MLLSAPPYPIGLVPVLTKAQRLLYTNLRKPDGAGKVTNLRSCSFENVMLAVEVVLPWLG